MYTLLLFLLRHA